MNKVYSRVNDGKGWKDHPSDESPLNAYNLNKGDIALDEIDNRVIMLDNTKATKVEVSMLVEEVAYDKQTGIITFTRKNGSKFTIDTPMEKIQTGIYYDPVTEMLTLPLIDGTTIGVDLSRLITEFEFLDSDTIAFSVSADGKVTAKVKKGSITEEYMDPDYLGNIKVESAKAETSAAEAGKSEAAAMVSQTEAKKSEVASKASEEAAAASAEDAANSAAVSLEESGKSTASAEAAKASEDAAAGYAEEAKASEESAKESKTAAAGSAEDAAQDAESARESATAAESFTHGGTGTRDGEDTDNAGYYYEQMKYMAERVSNALVPMGTVTFAQLMALTDVVPGDTYNISDEFTTTDAFKEGAGRVVPLGSNVYMTEDGYWDVLAGSPVATVNGETGNVIVTPAMIGAVPVGKDLTLETEQAKDKVLTLYPSVMNDSFVDVGVHSSHNIIIGAGVHSKDLHDKLESNSFVPGEGYGYGARNMYLSAGTLFFLADHNSIDTRRGFRLDSNGDIIPISPEDGTKRIGISANHWKEAYIDEIHGIAGSLRVNGAGIGWKMYSTTSALGLTDSKPTLKQILDAMPNCSEFMNFDIQLNDADYPDELPVGSWLSLHIWKYNNSAIRIFVSIRIPSANPGLYYWSGTSSTEVTLMNVDECTFKKFIEWDISKWPTIADAPTGLYRIRADYTVQIPDRPTDTAGCLYLLKSDRFDDKFMVSWEARSKKMWVNYYYGDSAGWLGWNAIYTATTPQTFLPLANDSSIHVSIRSQTVTRDDTDYMLAWISTNDGSARELRPIKRDDVRIMISAMGAVKSGTYYGLTAPTGDYITYIRTTREGIIPYAAATAGSGTCKLGTSAWYFGEAYIDKIYGTPIVGKLSIGGISIPGATMFFETISGGYFSGSAFINGAYTNAADNGVMIRPGGLDKPGLNIRTLNSTSIVDPTHDNNVYLGSASYRWKLIYAATSTISTSDRTKKKDIKLMSEDLTQKFILGLSAMIYKMIDGDSGRTHWGFIAQDVEELMNSIGMSSLDFAGFIKSPKVKAAEKEEYVDEEKSEEITDENGEVSVRTYTEKVLQKRTIYETVEGEYDYGLRYEEFIAPTIKFTQILYNKIDTLQSENQELKNRLARIEAVLGI